jgi:hypothetical protein
MTRVNTIATDALLQLNFSPLEVRVKPLSTIANKPPRRT